jgi:enterochelin esterase family protein
MTPSHKVVTGLGLFLGVVFGLTSHVAGQRGPATPAPSPLVDGDFIIRPPFSSAPETIFDNKIPHGTIHRFTMKSEESKIYPGIARDKPGAVVPYERPVAVYVPAQYVAGTPAPFIVVQDGYSAKYHLTVPTVLDKLIADRKVPVMIAVLVQHGGGDGPGSQRGLEYDTVSDTYMKFIETEVLPRVARDYKIAFTTDPDGRATMGGSSGAAAALSMAWFHPELYRRVLSYSGTFVNQARPSTELAPRGAWEFHATLFPNSEKKPLRIWMHVSEFDNGATRDEASFGNWVLANQHMAAVLKAKGYPYQYVYAEGARHTDANVILQTLPEALQWLWQGYPIK